MRNSAWWFSVALFLAFAVVGILSAAWDLADGGGTDWKTYFMFVGVPFFVTLAVQAWRAGVRVNEWGVSVVAEMSVRRIAWADVTGFELGGGSRHYRWVAARRRDGSVYKLASASAAVRQDKLAELKELLEAARRRYASSLDGA